MNVFFIRHGQSTFNEIFDKTGRPPHRPDARLTELGRAQARGLGERLSGITFCRALVSPLTRAIETAHIALPGVQIEISALHREGLFSSCDHGRPASELAREFPDLNFSDLAEHWWTEGVASPAREDVEENLQNRIAQFRRHLRGRSERNLAVVGHSAFLHRLTQTDLPNCGYLIAEL